MGTTGRSLWRRRRWSLHGTLWLRNTGSTRAVVAGEFDFTPRHRPEDVKNSADIGKFYGESFAKDLEALKKVSGEQLAKTIDFRGMFQLPAVGFLDLGLRHSIHHRGQLSVYLRPAGGKVPAIYGESYDSAEAKKSAGTA